MNEFVFAGFRLVRTRQSGPKWELIVGARAILLAVVVAGLIGTGTITIVDTVVSGVSTHAHLVRATR